MNLRCLLGAVLVGSSLLGQMGTAANNPLSLLFTAPVGSERSYQVTLSLWVQESGGPSGAAPAASVQPQTQVCRVLERVTGDVVQGREVTYAQTCRSSDASRPVLGRESLLPFIYTPEGRIVPPPNLDTDSSPPWPRLRSAQKLERTPWGDLPALYGLALERTLTFSDDLRAVVGSDGAMVGEVTRTLRPRGGGTDVLVRMVRAAGRVSSDLTLLTPLDYRYNLSFGPDGRLERGSFRAVIAYLERGRRTVGKLEAEIVRVGP